MLHVINYARTYYLTHNEPLLTSVSATNNYGIVTIGVRQQGAQTPLRATQSLDFHSTDFCWGSESGLSHAFDRASKGSMLKNSRVKKNTFWSWATSGK